MSTIENLLNNLWEDYCHLNPAAKKIYNLFIAEGETVLNDHIALRTFNHPRLGIERLAQFFKDHGYKECSDYHFKEKKLYAKHYEHTNEKLPKIFISELLVEKMSAFTQKTIETLVEQINPTTLKNEKFLFSGRDWKIDHKTYLKLADESEYASWVYAHGFRPNHFTVNINNLKKFPEIENVNQFLLRNNIRLNTSGGSIKGTPEDYLVQSSTMAEAIEIKFTEGSFQVPGCYYEFAKRFKLPNGKYYQGFVAASADKIFESTHRM